MDYFQKKRGLQNDGRMVKRFRTRSRMILTAVCVLMLLMAAGCGKAEEPVPVDLSSGDMEELQNGTAEDTGDDGVSGQDENGMENDAAEEADADADEEDSAENVPPEKAGENADGENGMDAQSAGNEKLEGDVWRVEADCFVICRYETVDEEGASYALAPAPGYEEENDLVTIHTTKDCVYQYRTVKNGGINPEDVSSRDGSFADVREGMSVIMGGNWQADGSFLADSVVLMSIE